MSDLQEVLRKKLLEAKKRNLKEIFGEEEEVEKKKENKKSDNTSKKLPVLLIRFKKQSGENKKTIKIPKEGIEEERKYRIVGGEEKDVNLERSKLSPFVGSLKHAVSKKEDENKEDKNYIDIGEDEKEKIRQKAREIMFQRIKNALEQYGR